MNHRYIPYEPTYLVIGHHLALYAFTLWLLSIAVENRPCSYI